jgi:hypothetical protein
VSTQDQSEPLGLFVDAHPAKPEHTTLRGRAVTLAPAGRLANPQVTSVPPASAPSSLRVREGFVSMPVSWGRQQGIEARRVCKWIL